eukprot:gnl/TRDRNA2_/TRDRNA2_173848_c2_seq1.p1 gnl/TRDRNA2_/TRDRNA2_173848_c2~~gnl/TRDRNA2_/TRDRNA2_173848_c2_seq1.p1  ORF type:complete len:313 (-),score=36.64 gnl/TRDRNA2_/TRDRNA2_173848_c2_seq1:214-1152(-)
MSKNFVAVRTKYYKKNDATRVIDHALRRHQNSENVIDSRTHQNFGAGAIDLPKQIQRYKETVGRSPRKDMNLVFEHVLVLSKDQLTKCTKKGLHEAVSDYMKQIKAEWGFEPLGYRMHLDEGHYSKDGKFIANPHAHIYFFNYDFEKKRSPLRDLMIKGRNEKGKSPALNPHFVKMQDIAAESFKKLGFRRGISKGEKNKKHQEKAEFVLSKTIKRYRSIKLLVQNLDSEIVKKKLIRPEKRKDVEQLEELERIHKQQIQPMIQSFEKLEELFENKQIEKFEHELENFKALQEKITEKDLKKSVRKLKKLKP